jgi:hypothetical protein
VTGLSAANCAGRWYLLPGRKVFQRRLRPTMGGARGMQRTHACSDACGIGMAAGSWLGLEVGAEAYLEPDLADCLGAPKGWGPRCDPAAAISAKSAKSSILLGRWRRACRPRLVLTARHSPPAIVASAMAAVGRRARGGRNCARRRFFSPRSLILPVQPPNDIYDFIPAVRESGSPSSPSSPKLRMVGPLRHTPLLEAASIPATAAGVPEDPTGPLGEFAASNCNAAFELCC